MTEIEIFKKWIDKSDNIVFFGGAGVSTESGIPDFRSVDGLYNQQYDYPPEEILSHSFFESNPEIFYKFYHDKLDIRGVEPNATHYALAKLEAIGKLKCVVTQNIDGLHQRAGSVNVAELHGTLLRNYCSKCGKIFSDSVYDCKSAPRCTCGGVIRPDVVLYEEALDERTVSKAISAIKKADMLIIGGTSLSVYPAAGLIRYYYGNKLVLINKSATPYDDQADLVIHKALGEVFGKI